MKHRMTAVKIAACVIAILLLGLFGGLSIAATEDTPEDILILETKKYLSYTITPEGYHTDYGEPIAHTGSYLICGEANCDVIFTSNGGENVTYDVILHNWQASAWDWYGLVSLDPGVTLNVTVYGDNLIEGYNHPAIKLSNPEGVGDDPVVNVTFTEGSRLTLGIKKSSDGSGCVDEFVSVSLSEGTESTADMSNLEWKREQSVTLSRGDDLSHRLTYTCVSDEVCRQSCSDCDSFTEDMTHRSDFSSLDEADEAYTTKHNYECVRCGYVLEVLDHDITYDLNESEHRAFCTDCDYSEPTAAHTFDEHGCTVCGEKYAASFTDETGETKYLTLTALLEGIKGKSGRVTLLRDASFDFSSGIDVESGELVIDLAGYKLKNMNAYVFVDAKLTVTDTSEGKTGSWSEVTSDYCYVDGELCLEGITVSKNIAIVNQGGVLRMKDVRVENLGGIIISYGVTVELTNVVYYRRLTVEVTGSFTGGLRIFSGFFAEICVKSYHEDLSVNRLLADGYAYLGEGGILDGTKNSISGVTAIVEHGEHAEDSVHSNGSHHWVACPCGYRSDTATEEEHSIGESGACPTCEALVVATVSHGEVIKYFTEIEAAFNYASTLTECEMRLLADATANAAMDANGDITLDLNGRILTLGSGRIYVGGKLTVKDSSANHTGIITPNDNYAYSMDITNGGSLTVDGGAIFGLIYTYVNVRIEINGGHFYGPEKFRLSEGTEIVINGGRFENRHGVIDLWSPSGITVRINGGTFVNSPIISNSAWESAVPSIEEALGDGSGCELIFADEYGNELTPNSLTYVPEGTMIVTHKGATLSGAINGHYLSCPTCYAISEIIEHHSPTYIRNNDAEHSIYCGVCEVPIGSAEHSGAEATCQNKATCQYCLAEYGEVMPHIAADAWTADESHHYHLCVYWTDGGGCQERLDYAAHADTDKNGECDTCGYGMSISPDNPTGPDNPTDPDNPSGPDNSGGGNGTTDGNGSNNGNGADDGNGLGAGGITLIVLGSVAAVGIGGFSLFWFVIKKKKWSDLIAIFKR